MVAIQFQAYLELSNPAGSLKSTAFIIQGGIFVSMVLGLTLVKRESVSYSEEMFYVISQAYWMKMIGKVLTLMGTIVCFTVLSLFLLYTQYYCYGVPFFFYGVVVPYLFLYWVVPFWIAGLIGMTVGLFVKSRIYLIFLVGLWICLGPLNHDILQNFFYLLPHIDPMPLLDFFNLGQTDPYATFDPVYGLQLEIHRWLQKGLILFTVGFALITVIQLKSARRFSKVGWIIFPVYLSICLLIGYFFIMKEDQVVVTGNRNNSVMAYDWKYYRNHTMRSFVNKTPFTVSEYDIRMKVFRNLSVQLNMKVIPQASGRDLVFSLYHDLKIKSVQMNAKPLTFQQKGDQLEVHFPAVLQQGEPITLALEYEGTSSPYFFANEQAIMLPNYFVWLPVPGSFQVMRYDQQTGLLLREGLYPNHPIHYQLNYEGPQPLFVNLPKTGPSTWQGSVPNGITLAGGKYLTAKTVNGMQIIYPQSLYRIERGFTSLEKNVSEANRLVTSSLGILQQHPPKYLFLLTIPEEGGDVISKSWVFRDHEILGIDQDVNNNPDFVHNQTYIIKSTISAYLKKQSIIHKSQEMKDLFTDAYLYWLQLQGVCPVLEEKPDLVRKIQINRESLAMLKNQLAAVSNPKDRQFIQRDITKYKNKMEMYEEVKRFIDHQKGNPHRLNQFFRKYYQLLNQPQELTWDVIRSRMNEKGDEK
ncbi:hypothetical protein JQC72_04775 [Polycladomyces sp. WAk]|uniref:Uncharacterized protein n=1 Tax=Polycladomyces zharkentensis TaxID=2807616 RepID=A0ABS2WH17_9BACL|nr:hypothetical protein [Polycladomyces sp. WAk]MBN2908837.1 hypothetical protein [Polycladomyces sp. WAk]